MRKNQQGTSQESFGPLEATTLRQGIVDRLKDAILGGRIPMGARLNESQLSRDLRVSRAPIREALQQLQQSGLVVNHPRRGMFVISLEEEDIQKINSLRVVLEGEALRLCRRKLTPDGQRRLSSLFERMERMKPTTAFQAAAIDLEFHRTLWSLTGNEYLERTLNSLTAPLFAYASLNRPKAERMRVVLDSHQPLLAFVTGQSKKSAETVMLAHLQLRWSHPEAFSSFVDVGSVAE